MKKLAIFLTTFIISMTSVLSVKAQPASGIVAGVNYSFYNNGSLNYSNSVETIDYDNGLGFQLGYQWAFPISKHFNVGVGAMYNYIKGNNTVTNTMDNYIKTSDEAAMFLSAPLTISYNLKRFYIGAGYEAGVNIARGNSNLPYDYMSFIGQVGYRFGRVGLQLKYILGIPKSFTNDSVSYDENGEISGYRAYKSSNVGNLQLSVVIPLKSTN